MSNVIQCNAQTYIVHHLMREGEKVIEGDRMEGEGEKEREGNIASELGKKMRLRKMMLFLSLCILMLKLIIKCHTVFW